MNMAAISLYVNSQQRDAVIALWRTVFGYEQAHNAPNVAIDAKLAANDGLFFVATQNAFVIGTILAGYDGHRGWLYSLSVHPDHTKKGLGSALVLHAEKALTERGCMKINLQILDTNHAVESFYKKLGYLTEPRVSMGKSIPMNIPSTL